MKIAGNLEACGEIQEESSSQEVSECDVGLTTSY